MPQVRTSVLDLDLRDEGPHDGPVALLLHGWPDCRESWDEVADRLVERGWRTLVPSLRGFGATRFLSADASRTANAAILAMDQVELLDALGVGEFCVAGHDWGSSTAEALAIGWPDRVRRLAMLASPPRLGGMPTPGFAQAQRYWYHWFMATDRGAEAVRRDPRGFARIQWQNWSPTGWFDDADFERAAVAFDNPDWVDVTLHSYRARWGEAEFDPRSQWLEQRIAATSALAVPTRFFQGEEDGVNPPSTSESIARKFSGPFGRIVLRGVGHFTQREAPMAVAEGLAELFES